MTREEFDREIQDYAIAFSTGREMLIRRQGDVIQKCLDELFPVPEPTEQPTTSTDS